MTITVWQIILVFGGLAAAFILYCVIRFLLALNGYDNDFLPEDVSMTCPVCHHRKVKRDKYGIWCEYCGWGTEGLDE
jgi:hypothetical protein